MFGDDEPDDGHLFDDMIVASGGSIDCSRLIQPKAEPEIGFLLAKELRGPGMTADDVLRATSLIARPPWKSLIAGLKTGKSDWLTRFRTMLPAALWCWAPICQYRQNLI